MEVRQVVNTIFGSCSYVITRDGASWLVDCGDVDRIVPFLVGPLNGVLLTHAHFDHIYGLNTLMTLYPMARVYTNLAGKDTLMSDKLNLSRYHESPFVLNDPDRVTVVDDGDSVSLFEGVEATAIYTPGHSPCCITWLTSDSIFTGDSLIPGVKTVVNLPRADKQQALISEQRIRALAVERQIYPGHAPQLYEQLFK